MCILHTLTFYDCQHTKTQTIPCPAFQLELISGEIRRKNASLCAMKTAKNENLAGACPNCYIKDYALLVNEEFRNRTAAEAEALEGGGGGSGEESGGWTPVVSGLGSGESTPKGGGGGSGEESGGWTPVVSGLGSGESTPKGGA